MERTWYDGVVTDVYRCADGAFIFDVRPMATFNEFGMSPDDRVWDHTYPLKIVRGYVTGKSPRDYREFGRKGLAVGVRVRCFQVPGRNIIDEVVPTPANEKEG